ncbi:LacI family DNA-binding transcriptional regulator [Catellatospora sp. KI3]|uniref:LacI family DNA-binding transcriptional regulator n=1 Tax=Catellatospora sp. KI3 TaxID=3041620 RepID=UPI00248239C7|nr:LacI family DNA-binding transcriptional regulator [Catellatospora sp. KI3]MDI1460826.1 LacI family DNA-binding transcriptional regulator [Catellatospora sp. KI3]
MPHPSRPTVTLHDVAAAAGVSVATASRVLGGSSRTVAPEYERKVLAAAAELRYTSDMSARAMRRKSDSIALVADDLTTPTIGIVVAAMERQARTVESFVSVSSTGGTPERQYETVRTLCALRPQALVLTSSRFEAKALGGRLLDELLAYEQQGGRVVVFGNTDMPFDSITVDDRGSARPMGAHLAQTGHQRVVILAGPRDKANVSARTSGFVEGLLSGGVDAQDVRIVNCEVSRQGGFDATTRLIEEGLGQVEAIVAANDLIAVGALSACRAGGVAVPSRVSVAGFDDIQLAVDVTPRLTTVALPLAEIGAESIRLALAPRSGAEAPAGPGAGGPTRETVLGTLVVRDSTTTRTS